MQVYASAKRQPSDVYARWILGSGPCGSDTTNIMDRICVESSVDGKSLFEPMHPWTGGDYNPFEGLDVCPGSGPGFKAAETRGN